MEEIIARINDSLRRELNGEMFKFGTEYIYYRSSEDKKEFAIFVGHLMDDQYDVMVQEPNPSGTIIFNFVGSAIEWDRQLYTFTALIEKLARDDVAPVV